MKEKLIKVAIPILVIVLILVFSNFLLYITACVKNKAPLINFNNIFKENFSVRAYAKNIEKQKFNKKNDENKNGIIVLGANFDNGMLAEELAKKMNVTAYNLGIGGSFIQHAILLIQNHYYDDEILHSKNVIFLCPSTSDFLRQVVYPGDIYDPNFLLNRYLYPRFNVANSDELVEYKSKIPFIKGSVLYKFISRLYNEFLYGHNNEFKNAQEYLMIMHLTKLQEELKQINPEIKVSLLMYFNEENNITNLKNELSYEEINSYFATSLVPNFDELLKEKNLTSHEAAEQSFIWEKIAESLSKNL